MSSTEIVLATGELIPADELHNYAADVLAEAALMLRERERKFAAMRHELERELIGRLEQRSRPRAPWTVGEYEMRLRWSSVWDVEELEGVLADLHERGLLPARAGELFRRKVEANGTNLNRLVPRLEDEAREAVEACRKWRQNGVEIVPSVPLLPPDN